MTAIGRTASPRRRQPAGFTLLELLIYMVISVVVLGAIYKVIITQQRAYGKQRELLDVRESIRSVGALLSWELRQAGTAGSTILVAGTNSVTLRSMQGLGIVCARHANLPIYALWRTSGDFQATADDSALVYEVGSSTWAKFSVAAVGTPASLGVSTCAWPGARTPDIAVQLGTIAAPADTAGIKVGAPIRLYRKTEYAEYLDAGRWWLGRRIGAAVSYEQLAGPLFSPTDSGMRFRYYNSAGAVTATLSAIVRVEVLLRAQSLKTAINGSGLVGYQTDSTRTRVVLRQ